MPSLLLRVVAVLTCSCAFAKGQPATVPAAGEQATANPFRTQAMVFASQMRVYVNEADGIDENDRAELRRLIDEYEGKVDAQARQVPATFGPHVEKAEEMAEEFQEKIAENWLPEHPKAQAAIERVEAALMSVADALFGEQDKIVAAAARAGLPKDKQGEASKVVNAAFAELQEYGRRTQEKLQEAGRLPEDDPKRLESMTILADVEMEKLRVATEVRRKLRELLPAERRQQFDDELAKLAGN